MIFKVGDVVRVLRNHPQDSYFRKGDEFEVEELIENEIWGRMENKDLNYVYVDDIEHVTLTRTHMPAWF